MAKKKTVSPESKARLLEFVSKNGSGGGSSVGTYSPTLGRQLTSNELPGGQTYAAQQGGGYSGRPAAWDKPITGLGNGTTGAAKKSFNLGSWALNFANVGGYSTGNKVNAISDIVKTIQGKKDEDTERILGIAKNDGFGGLVRMIDQGGFASAIGTDVGQAKDNTYSHAFKSMGANDTVAGVGGFAGDVLLDPLTYVSLGAGAAVKGAAKGAAAGVRATKAGEKLTDITTKTVDRADWIKKNPFMEKTRQAFTPVTDATKSGNMFSNVLGGAAKGVKVEHNAWSAQNSARAFARQQAKQAKKNGTILGAGTLPAAGADLARQSAQEAETGLVTTAARQVDELGAQSAALGRATGEADEAPNLFRQAADAAPERTTADEALDVAAKQMDEEALPTLRPDAGDSPSVRAAQADRAGMFDRIADLQTPENIGRIVREGISRNVPVKKASVAERIEKKVTPFQETKLLDDLDTGANGWQGLARSWKDLKDGKELSRVRAAYKPQIEGLAKKRMPVAGISRELHEAIGELRPAALTGKSITGGDLLDLISKGTKGYANAKPHFRPQAITEARQAVHSLVKAATPRTVAGSRSEQMDAWKGLVSKQLGGDPVATSALVEKLAKITDPAEFSSELEKFTRSTRTTGFKNFSDLMRFIDKTDAKTAANQLEGSAAEIKELLRKIGIKTPYNEKILGMTNKLKTRGQEAYDETTRAAIQQRTLLNDQAIPGGDQIEKMASDFDPELAVAAARQEAKEAFENAPDLIAAAAMQGISDGLRYSIGGYARLGKEGVEFVGKNGTVTRAAKDKSEYIAHSWNQQSNLAAYKSIVQAGAKSADAAGIKGADARAAHMYDFVVESLGIKDSWLRANGVVPVTYMTRAEGNLRKMNVEKAEFAYLSDLDVIAALPRNVVEAALFYGKNVNLPITEITNAARLAIKRPELGKSVEDFAAVQKTVFLAAANRMKNSFTQSSAKNAEATADAIIRTLNDPDIVQELTKTHLANGVFARSALNMANDAITAETRQTLENTLASSVALGTKFAAIEDSSKRLDAVLKAADMGGSQIDTLARMQQDIILAGAMSKADFYAYKAAYRSRRAGAVKTDGTPAPDEYLDKMRAIANDQMTKIDSKGNKVLPKPRAAESVRQAADRKGQNAARLVDQAEISETVQQAALKALADEPLEAQDAYTYAMLQADIAFTAGKSSRLGERFLDAMSPTHGQQDTRIYATLEGFGPRAMTAEYDKALAGIVKKHKPDALKAAFKVFQQLDSEAMDAAFTGFSKSAEAGSQILTRELGQQALLGALVRKGITPQSLPEGTIQAAQDLMPAFQIVFGGDKYSLIARAGLDPKFMNTYLRRAGMSTSDEGGFAFPEDGVASDLYDAWRYLDGEAVDPIDLLRKTHAGLQQAAMVPAVASHFSTEFGHKALGYESVEAARRAGFKKVNFSDAESNSILRFIDTDQYYDPAMIQQLKKTGDFMDMIGDPAAEGVLERYLKKADPVMNAVKSSLTIWRPGHWVGNILGEGWMNMMAGVTNPMAYKKSLDILRQHNMVGPYQGNPFEKYLAKNAPEGQVAKFDIDEPNLKVTVGGAEYPVTYDTIKKMAEKRGVILHHNQAEDLFVDPTSPYKKRFGLISDANAGLGQASAARDSIFRLAHFVDNLQKYGGRNIDEMADRAAAEVHKYHPSMQTLSGFEQGTMRRLVYFYTWQKQALTRVIGGMLDTPGRVTVPNELLYAIGVGNGLDPESIGNPVDRDAMVPSFLQNSLTGTQFKAGYNPFGDGDMLWGLSLSNPTTDILSSTTASMNYDGNKSLGENAIQNISGIANDNGASMISPALKVPFQLATQKDSFGRDLDMDPAKNFQFLIDQTGAQYPSRVSGSLLPGVPRTDVKDDPEQQEGNQVRYALNWLSGLKFNNFQQQSYMDRAESELGKQQQAELVARLEALGYQPSFQNK